MSACTRCKKDGETAPSPGGYAYCPACTKIIARVREKMLQQWGNERFTCLVCKKKVDPGALRFIHFAPFVVTPCCNQGFERSGLLPSVGKVLGSVDGRTWFNAARVALRIFTKL